MARIRVGKDGRTGTIDEKELPLFTKDGWTVVDAPQAGEGEEASPEDQAADASRERREALYDAGNGAMTGLTMGFDDVVAGGAAAAGDAYQSWADGRPRDPAAYQQGVDGRREEVRQSRERSPTATSAGEFAGTLATIAVPGGRILKAPIGKLAKVGRAAATGAVGGAAGGVGFGDSDDLGGAAGDAAGGAAFGAVVGGTLGTAALAPAALGAAKRGGWRSLLQAGKALDEKLSKQGPLIDAAADAIPGVPTARRLAKRYGVLLDDVADEVNPKDVVDELPDWLRQPSEGLDDVVAKRVDPRALPLTETAEEIARRKAIQSFLLED